MAYDAGTGDATCSERPLTFHQAAEVLGVSIATLKRRTSEGTAPPFYRIGGKKFILQSTLSVWIRAKQRAALITWAHEIVRRAASSTTYAKPIY